MLSKKTVIFIGKYIVLVFFLNACKVIAPLTSSYYSNDKKVGILYEIDPIDVVKNRGNQKLLAMAVTSGDKHMKVVNKIEDMVDSKSPVVNSLEKLLAKKGKSFIRVDKKLDEVCIDKFMSPKKSKQSFYDYDLRHLSSEGIDELMIVKVSHGLQINYSGAIATGKKGYCSIDTRIVNLIDNSYIGFAYSYEALKIEGKWNQEPNFEPLVTSINLAISNVVERSRLKLDL